LPDPLQDQVVTHLREYLEDLSDELQWDTLFKKTQPQLMAAARRAKQQIAEGQATPMDVMPQIIGGLPSMSCRKHLFYY
jgi:hypothetical protein